MLLLCEIQRQPQQKFICRLMNITAISVALKVWKQFVDDVCSHLKCTHLENFFHHINSLHQNIKSTMEKEINRELACLNTLIMERSLFWYMGSLRILINTYTPALTTKQVARKVLFPPCLREHKFVI